MLTLQEAWGFLRIPEGTLRHWRHLGAGRRSFTIARHARYWRADLVLWLTEQTNRSQERRLGATDGSDRASGHRCAYCHTHVLHFRVHDRARPGLAGGAPGCR
jgi:hypothetical protein